MKLTLYGFSFFFMQNVTNENSLPCHSGNAPYGVFSAAIKNEKLRLISHLISSILISS